MERTRCVTAVLVLVIAAFASAETDTPVSVLLQEALYAEQIEGDLDGAIKIYEQVITKAEKYNELAAQASYRMGLCFLKKGEEEKAAAQFEAVVTKYPDQEKLAEKAREQLAELRPSGGKGYPHRPRSRYGTIPSKQQKPTFGPVIEVELKDVEESTDAGLIDFDSGNIVPTPEIEEDSKAFEWMRVKGVDAWHNEGYKLGSVLYGLDMAFVPLTDIRFEDASPEKIIYGVGLESVHTHSKIIAGGERPRIYIFKTREGGMGILQILEITRKERIYLNTKLEEELYENLGLLKHWSVRLNDAVKKNDFDNSLSFTEHLYKQIGEIDSKINRAFSEHSIQGKRNRHLNYIKNRLEGARHVIEKVRAMLKRKEMQEAKASVKELNRIYTSIKYNIEIVRKGPAGLKIRYKMVEDGKGDIIKAVKMIDDMKRMFAYVFESLKADDFESARSMLDTLMAELEEFEQNVRGSQIYDSIHKLIEKLKNADQLLKQGKAERAKAVIEALGNARAGIEKALKSEAREFAKRILSGEGNNAEKLSFGPVIERVIEYNDALDFETGKVFKITETIKGMGPEAAVGWAVFKGIDAGFERELLPLDMAVKEVSGKSWHEISPAKLKEIASEAVAAKGFEPMPHSEQWPPTYAFRTREAGIGILQIVGASDKGVKIRYKMLEEKSVAQFEDIKSALLGRWDIRPTESTGWVKWIQFFADGTMLRHEEDEQGEKHRDFMHRYYLKPDGTIMIDDGEHKALARLLDDSTMVISEKEQGGDAYIFDRVKPDIKTAAPKPVTVFLPECDTTTYDLLDLATGQIINSEPKGKMINIKDPNGKGNLYFDISDGQFWIACIRGTRMRLHSGDELSSSEPQVISHGVNAYYLLGATPCQYRVITARGEKYELKVLSVESSKDKRKGITLKYWKLSGTQDLNKPAAAVDREKAQSLWSILNGIGGGLEDAIMDKDFETAGILADRLNQQLQNLSKSFKGLSLQLLSNSLLDLMQPLKTAIKEKDEDLCTSILYVMANIVRGPEDATGRHGEGVYAYHPEPEQAKVRVIQSIIWGFGGGLEDAGMEEDFALAKILADKFSNQLQKLRNLKVFSSQAVSESLIDLMDPLEKAIKDENADRFTSILNAMHNIAETHFRSLKKTAEKATEHIERQHSASAMKLRALGKALLIFASEHNDIIPATLQELKPYIEQDFQWFIDNVEYVGEKTSTSDAADKVIAYDKTLLEKGNGTFVLFLDSHVDFLKSEELTRIGFQKP